LIISLDTETTGIDVVHGTMPFLVTTCDDSNTTRFWEWDVDPLTRKPEIPNGDLADISELIDAADLIYLHNSKFDYRIMLAVGVCLPWEKVRDTLCMGHLLASNHKHNLTDTCKEYLGPNADIEPLEISIKEVTRICRTIVKREYPNWRIAEEGLDDMPSVKAGSKRDEDKPWKNDMWLPRALIKAGCSQFIPEHWATACSKYANGDSEHTLPLGLEMERLIRERRLWKIYEHRMNLPRIACEMECYGVTAIGQYTESTIQDYGIHIAEAECELVAIAAEYGHDLELAKGAAINDNMRDFFYGSVSQECPQCGVTKRVKHWAGEYADDQQVCEKCLRRKRGPSHNIMRTIRHNNLALKIIGNKKSGGACLDKDAMHDYLATTGGAAYDFIKILTDKRKHDTDLSYMESYRRFWVPVHGSPGYYRIHPSLNPFATDHLRWASNSPNLQNVGKQEDECEDCDGRGCAVCNNIGKSRLSVRYCFGPAPGREWYALDYKSIERRIPAYESGEPKMVEVFEKPNEPPYWGSLYNLTASVLYPAKYWPLAEVEGKFKRDEPRLYKQSKFFDLAKQYGCGRKKGDMLSKVPGSFDLVDQEFPLLAKLQAHYLRQAEQLGYVETMPDLDVDPDRGYPILPSRTNDGRILSTTPFNYHVSGTACWVKNKALVRCSAQCAEWRRDGFDAHMVLEVHDELLFDFPRGPSPDSNRDRALALKKLMELSGNDIGMPTPVSVEYHPESWAKGVAV
jgi:DNA polymerase I-like protein with 3'-5' exonuclease and polymerase domains